MSIALGDRLPFHAQFYQQTFNAYDAPLSQAHFSVEGNVDFKALLFLPSEVPYELSRDVSGQWLVRCLFDRPV